MKKTFFWAFLLCIGLSFAQDDSAIDETMTFESIQKVYDSIAASFTYEKGTVVLDGDMATITVPKGYKFLNAEQSKKVLTDLWGNPPSEPLGMLFPEDISPVSDNFTYAVEITYSEEGYIDDEDAKDIDYDELLEEMKKDTELANPERVKLGYGTMDMVGWASAPYYDEVEKKLHWAKELKFENTDVNTLNYNIRVLGRKGYLNLNVIGDMTVLPMVKNNVDKIIASAAFTEGNKYSDFNPDVDKVAAYGIGGLIAGKVLAKAGFFALLLKFWKFIAIGAVALFTALKGRIFGKK
ncbi:DUF2167 domain-containing protein [Pseudofulvibacter geojedonensis]|uniref:DUF2167 domain-containing protein n=1 Tax=Pseudofulvibacter geojedonensis TaxID=1123758 RepID=A0ABW3I307_9FLAO